MRKITSLSLGFAFLIMSYTGVILYFVPKGKVAYWSDWHLFGLSKTQYGEIHTTSMVTFLFFGIWHIYYNWKPIVSYLKDKQKKVSFTKKEFLIAFGLNFLFVLGTLYMIQPFKSFLDLQDSIKDGWTKEYGEPPYGHAEETKLKVFCKKMDINYDEASKILTSNNIVFKAEESLLVIGKNNNMSPSGIYKLISKNTSIKKNINSTSSRDKVSIPSRLGRKTLQELSDMQKIDLDKAISTLKAKGLSDISSESKIKNIADELSIMPIDVYKLLIN